MEKKLTLSDSNKFIGGVCGGVGEYLGVDPTAIRLVCAILTFVTGFIPGVLLYVAAMFIVPSK
ncbi:MAG: PspC domain-containing protein [Ruminiclostridium sp.]|nr:PspC domain-containing protein [Ruminiclostridium sp.]